MDYESLQKSHWDDQIRRVEELRQKISSRPKLGDGRVVPQDNSLTICDGTRLSMAVMFVDICGFSSRPMETLDEQDITLRVLNLFFTEMIRIATEYGGHVEKNTGDGLLIYFNDQEGIPRERGTKRAVASALTMFAANDYLISPILHRTPTAELQFRVSIEYGFVAVARIGAPREFNANTVIGTTANFASKMLQYAEPNEIVIGETARSQLPEEWQRVWTEQIPASTGWVYRISQKPYPLYRYKGRWRCNF